MPVAQSAVVQQKPEPAPKRIIAWLKDKVLAGVLLFILAGLSAWWWAQAPDLRYSVGEVSSHDVSTGTIEATVSNKGSLSAEDVDCEVKVTKSEIKTIVCDPSIFKATVSIDVDHKRAIINIPRINSQEAIKIKIEATNPFQLSKTLEIVVRGKDIPVSKESQFGHRSLFGFLVFEMWPLIVLLLLAGVAQAWLMPKLKTKIEASKVKLFRFHNGPMSGRYIVWPESKELYEKMTRRRTVLPVGETTYFVWSMVESEYTIKFEMVCNDGTSPTPEALSTPDLGHVNQVHLL